MTNRSPMLPGQPSQQAAFGTVGQSQQVAFGQPQQQQQPNAGVRGFGHATGNVIVEQPPAYGRLGDAIPPAPADTLPAAHVTVDGRQPTALPSGRKAEDVPGLPAYQYAPNIRGFEVERDRYGRYVLPNPETGERRSYTRATTFAAALKDADSGHIGAWKDRELIKGLVRYPQLVEGLQAELIGTSSEWKLKQAMADIAENARIAAGSADKREFGQAVHGWTEYIDHLGAPFSEVPQMFQAHVAAYENALAEQGIVVIPEYVERIVYNPATETVGTLDRIFQLPDGQLVIGDIKTSSNISFAWLEISAQMATYADALYMLSQDGQTWEPMPPVSRDTAVIIHVPGLPDNRDVYAEVVTINLEPGRNALMVAGDVRAARRTGKRVSRATVSSPTPIDTAIARVAAGQLSPRTQIGQWENYIKETGAGRIHALNVLSGVSDTVEALNQRIVSEANAAWERALPFIETVEDFDKFQPIFQYLTEANVEAGTVKYAEAVAAAKTE